MKPARQREMVDHVRTAWQISIRRACRALPVERLSYHYRCRRAGQAPLSKRIKEIAESVNRPVIARPTHQYPFVRKPVIDRGAHGPVAELPP
jgi:hypothetical protein